MHRLAIFLVPVLLIGCGKRGPVAVPAAAELPRVAPGTHQQTADVPGVGSVRYTIVVPAGYDGKSPVPLVLALHYGYDGATPAPFTGGDMIKAFWPGLSDLNAIVVAPDALGGSWTSDRNESSAVWLVRSVMKSYAIDPARVVVTGFSLGGEGAWHVGSRHQDLFTGAIPVAAPVAGGSAKWTIPVYVIHSDKDDVVSYSAAKKHADALQAQGAKLEMKTINGLGHFDTGAYASHVGEGVKWLQSLWRK